MNEYTTKEMKAGQPEVKVDQPKTWTIEVKRGRYTVKNLEGITLGHFNSEKDAKEFTKEL